MVKWQWKEKDGSSGGLLYEPGNWGDILKGEWLLRVLKFLDRAGSREAAYLDLYAGMPVYPVTPACRQRLALLPPDLLLPTAVKEYLKEDQWPSSAKLSADYFAGERAHGKSAEECCLQVCEADAGRRERLAGEKAFTLLEEADGRVLLPVSGEFRLILVDPYDFLAEWKSLLPLLMTTAISSPLLLYVYNRSGKSKAYLQDYRRFRSALQDSQRRILWGRTAADPFLPECWHEMFFFPARLSDDSLCNDLVAELSGTTCQIAEAIRKAGLAGEFSGGGRP